MDIKHLEYFTEIVNCHFNISLAAKKVNISQPALSAIVKNFESTENRLLFERLKGRLHGLTPHGEIFYKNAKVIIANYSSMVNELRASSLQFRGKVRIGVPPFILSTLFADILTDIILDNPDIQFDIVEFGAYELRKQLLSKRLDFAVLLQPTDISGIIQEHTIHKGELLVFMDKHHSLAHQDKINWNDLDKKPFSILDDTFMIHHQIFRYFEDYNIKPRIVIMSSSWDFLLASVKKRDILTILPSPMSEVFNDKEIIGLSMKNPIKWKVVLCHHKFTTGNRLQSYVLKEILHKHNQKVASL